MTDDSTLFYFFNYLKVNSQKKLNKIHKVKSIADFAPVDPMISREWCVYEQEKLPKIGNGVKQKKSWGRYHQSQFFYIINGPLANIL